jgi:hypothetical protein
MFVKPHEKRMAIKTFRDLLRGGPGCEVSSIHRDKTMNSEPFYSNDLGAFPLCRHTGRVGKEYCDTESFFLDGVGHPPVVYYSKQVRFTRIGSLEYESRSITKFIHRHKLAFHHPSLIPKRMTACEQKWRSCFQRRSSLQPSRLLRKLLGPDLQTQSTCGLATNARCRPCTKITMRIYFMSVRARKSSCCVHRRMLSSCTKTIFIVGHFARYVNNATEN